MIPQNSHALLLNADATPIRRIPWAKAWELVYDRKAFLVEAYDGDPVRSMTVSFERPAVVQLKTYVKIKNRAKFNRQNVLARDKYVCQYCGRKPSRNGRTDMKELTLDHIIPRSHAVDGKVFLPWSKKIVYATSWENIVCACYSCNSHKAARTPEQAGMKLKEFPRIPSPVDSLIMSLTRIRIPDEWKFYLPEGSEWSGYWTDELESH